MDKCQYWHLSYKAFVFRGICLLTVISSLNHSFNIEKIESFFRAVCVGVQLLWGSRGGMPALSPNQTGLRSSEENVVQYKFTRN